jgi:hypothetical protein
MHDKAHIFVLVFFLVGQCSISLIQFGINCTFQLPKSQMARSIRRRLGIILELKYINSGCSDQLESAFKI